MSQYFRSLLQKKVKVWILLWVTDKGTNKQAWLIPEMNGEVKYSQFTRGCRGNHLTPVSLEPKATQSFCMDQ